MLVVAPGGARCNVATPAKMNHNFRAGQNSCSRIRALIESNSIANQNWQQTQVRASFRDFANTPANELWHSHRLPFRDGDRR